MIQLVLLCALLLPVSGTVQAAITHVKTVGTVNAKGASSTTTTFTVGANGASAGNNIIIAIVVGFSAGEDTIVPACTDTKGNIYTTDVDFFNQATAATRTAICSSRLTTSLTTGDVITVTHASQPARALSVDEFSGLAATNPLDKTAGGFGSSLNALSALTATTTQADELVFGAVGVRGPITETYTKGASYTALTRDGTTGASATGNRTINPEYKIVSSTGTYAADGTLGTSTAWIAVVATYKAATTSSTCTVTNTNDSGAGSLRQCITTANSTPGTTIAFNIPGPANQSSGADSWWRITPITALPAISGANTIIDATTQTTNQGNTNSLGPEIELNGATVGAGGWDGFGVISPATGVVIKGFIINRWSGAGISFWTGTGTATGNYIGTNYAGTAALANTAYGIYLNTNGNMIGGTTAGDRNVISGNGGPGLYIVSNNNNVQGNYIGVNASASAALANASHGINILSAATGGTIGGTTAGAGNVISGNTGDGINQSASGANTVQGNYIGTNAVSTSLPNGGDGIDTSAGIINLGNASESQSNVIGPNTGAGLNLTGGTINLAGTINVRDDVALSTGTLTMGSATLNLSGNWTRTSATVTPGTSTVVLNGTTNQIITSGGASFNHLTLNNTGTSGSDNIDIVGALDINGVLTITDGVLDISTTAPANNAAVNTAGNVTIGTNGGVNVTGRTANWTFDGASILTDSSSGGPQQLNDVIVNGTSLTLGSSAKMQTLTVTMGTMSLGASGYTLEITGTGIPLSNNGTFSAGTSTVKYTGTTTATSVATVPYSSLWLAPTAATTYSLTGNLTGGNAMTGNLIVDTSATLDATSANNYNLSAVNVTINGTYTARNSTITASGNWSHTNGTFNYGASTVNLTGTGTITINMASWWTKPFYNLTAAAVGQTTNFNTTLGVSVLNILTLGTGTVTGGQVVLEKPSGTPFVNAGATLSNTAFRYQTDAGPVNITAAAYPTLLLSTASSGTPTFSLAGNITCGNLQFFFNQPSVNNTLSLTTSASNYSITCASLELGVTGATASQNTLLNLNSSTVTFTGGVTINPNTVATLTGGTLNVGGNWTNNGNFTASSGAIVLTGANQTITGNSIFNTFTKSVTAAQTLTFAAGSTITINGTATLNGTAGQLLSLRSGTPGTRWNFNLGASATKAISYVNVQDSDASGSAAGQKPIGPTNSTDAGNNIAWFAIPTVVKSMTVISDPVNNTINPKAIPGAVIEYTITIANGAGGSTATNIVVTDNLNGEITGGRLAFNPNTYAAGQGIQVAAPNINGGAALNLTNAADADAGDFNMTGTNTVTVSGMALNAGQSATIKFRMTVQ